MAVMEERKKGPGVKNRLKRASKLRNRRLRQMKATENIALLAARYTHGELIPAAEIFEELEQHPDETPDIPGAYDMRGGIEFTLEELVKLIDIQGTAEMQKRLVEVVKRHASIFSTSVRQQAAKITPYTMKVDVMKWQSKKNQGPPRPQRAVINEEIRKQCAKLEALGVIAKCHESFWSQVHMVPKPNGSWRFCIDFRRLNDATEARQWHIPNIWELLTRIGRKKYKATLDLTSGYHQAPVAPTSVTYTTFKIIVGILQRV